MLFKASGITLIAPITPEASFAANVLASSESIFLDKFSSSRTPFL